MARLYARVKVEIWRDMDFRSLSTDAQHLYFVLLTSPTLNLAGVGDWRPARLAALAGGWTPARVRKAGEELAAARYIVVDEDTEEVLIRSFVRHDGVLKGPKTAVSMAKDYGATASRSIMSTLAIEVARAADEEPDLKGLDCVADIIESGKTLVSEGVSDTQTDTQSTEDAPSIPIPHPSTNSLQPRASRRSPSRPLPDDWKPNAKHEEFAREHGIDLAAQSHKFRGDAVAKDKRYANWDQAFRNWLDKAIEFGQVRHLPRPERPSLALLPKCPTCNAPQEITHYEECPDQEWRPTA